MATNADAWAVAVDRWTPLATHDWEGDDAIEGTLAGALSGIDDDSSNVVLYDHVDLEAITDALVPGSPERGASEVRFEYGHYEIKIEADGTIAAR